MLLTRTIECVPAVTVFLCGDVMLGRGMDQILSHPGDPTLHEQHVRDARQYVELAQLRNGPIPYPIGDVWPWGDALQVLDELAPNVRIINLETSITQADDFAPGKAVHYRMSPGNVPCLAAAAPDVCVWRTTTCSTSAVTGWPTHSNPSGGWLPPNDWPTPPGRQ
jgi:poly-gamma-glutamate capsule biosynthesis protein CapA/YwtB (metallophosphatase superfamily)